MATLSSLFDFVRNPPARIPGTKLAALFKGLEAKPDDLMTRTYTELLTRFGISSDHKLSKTGIALAQLIDSNARYGGHGNPYHNRAHMLEVMVSTALLLSIHEREKFQPEFTLDEKQLVLTAALGHDFGHDGRGNGLGKLRVPLMNETRTLWMIEPIMAEKFGRYRQPQMEETFSKYRALVVSTDIAGGAESPARIFIETAAFNRGEREEPPVVDTPDKQYYANLLDAYPHLAELSCLLQDADTLLSTSATPEWVLRQEKAMAEERPATRTPEGEINWSSALWFHENMAGAKSLAGKTFAANHERTKAYVRGLAQAPQPE